MEILHQDKDIAVIVKPVGLESQAAVPAELEKQLGGTFCTGSISMPAA